MKRMNRRLVIALLAFGVLFTFCVSHAFASDTEKSKTEGNLAALKAETERLKKLPPTNLFADRCGDQQVSTVPKPNNGGHICWVDHVEKTTTGINVYFSSTCRVTVAQQATGNKPTIFYDYTVCAVGSPVLVQTQRHDVGASLSVGLGDRIGSANSPEDSCTMYVVMQDGKMGLSSTASFNPPGLGSNTAKEFIPAE